MSFPESLAHQGNDFETVQSSSSICHLLCAAAAFGVVKEALKGEVQPNPIFKGNYWEAWIYKIVCFLYLGVLIRQKARNRALVSQLPALIGLAHINTGSSTW